MIVLVIFCHYEVLEKAGVDDHHVMKSLVITVVGSIELSLPLPATDLFGK